MYNTNFSKTDILKVWQKGRPTFGYNSNIMREDEAGALIKFSKYGNTDSEYGWEIDHIVPKSLGGSDSLANLQPLHWENNRSKGDDYPRYNLVVTSRNGRNVYYSGI